MWLVLRQGQPIGELLLGHFCPKCHIIQILKVSHVKCSNENRGLEKDIEMITILTSMDPCGFMPAILLSSVVIVLRWTLGVSFHWLARPIGILQMFRHLHFLWSDHLSSVPKQRECFWFQTSMLERLSSFVRSNSDWAMHFISEDSPSLRLIIHDNPTQRNQSSPHPPKILGRYFLELSDFQAPENSTALSHPWTFLVSWLTRVSYAGCISALPYWCRLCGDVNHDLRVYGSLYQLGSVSGTNQLTLLALII